MPIKVVVVGAGLAGLGAAISLSRAGHEVQVIEQSGFLNEVGAAIHVAPNATRILKAWGCDLESLHPVHCNKLQLWDASGNLICTPIVTKECQMALNTTDEWLLTHRVDLHNALRAAATNEVNGCKINICLSSRVLSVDAEAGEVVLEDGTTYVADLVVGADGIHSRTVHAVVGENNGRQSTGQNCFRFLVPMEKMQANPLTASLMAKTGTDGVHAFVTHDRRIVVYPCRSGQLLNVAGIHPADKNMNARDSSWLDGASLSQLLETYQDFGEELQEMCRLAEDLKLWSLASRSPAPTFVRGKLALIGDAAHPMLPHQGQGAAQAFEDAAALGGVMTADMTAEQVPQRLELYNKVRYKHAVTVMMMSKIHDERRTEINQRISLIDRIRRIDERRAEAGVIGWKIGDIAPQIGVPSLLPEGLRWIESRTGTVIPLPNLCHAPWEKPPLSSTSLDLDGVQEAASTPSGLPARAVLKRYLDVYTSSAIHIIFPVISPLLFSQTIRAAYLLPEHDRKTHCPSSRACIFAFLALVSSLDPLSTRCTAPEPPPIPRDEYIMKAQALFPSLLQEPLNLDAIQTALLLSILGTLTGELQTATNYNSIASRFIIALGAHTMGDPCVVPEATVSGSRDKETRKHLRDLFWLCYSLDKDLSLRTGQSHCLRDEDCDLQLPPGYTEKLHPDTTYSSMENAHGRLFPIELRLSMIKSQIFTVLYSHSGLQKNDADVIRSIRELDEELELWRMSMPSHLRPKLSFAKERPEDQRVDTMYLVLTHLNYYFCVNIIHLAGSRCAAWRSASTPAGMMDGLRLSLTLSVEASRSLLLFLHYSESLNPHSPSATGDTQLLAATEHMTERVFLRQLSRADKAAHLHAITGFISSLRDLAQRAVHRDLSNY
ncbi:hypothetical protein BDV26DRAFT_286391 [Aspergillus bertholletiae]|uniref:Xylanolytic transcriptional activator regulatory domain-containing protein n=1 Tax=Aspergillus bertholletiae TaxID=1226010 RepID=A0A5N7APX8_9EURO|nr:hypothetical protein BDV26DRAFT_286391 [Aspergillus bertholletiae]